MLNSKIKKFISQEQKSLVDLNPQVSILSAFNDDVWSFEKEIENPSLGLHYKILRWNWQFDENRNFLMPQFANLRITLKEISYILLKGEIKSSLKPTTLANALVSWRLFVSFLINRSDPIYRFSHVLKSDIEEYLSYLKNRPNRDGMGVLSPSTFTRHLDYLNYIYDLKEYLSDALLVRPTGNQSASSFAGYKDKEIKTDFIKDAEASLILRKCLDYINDYWHILADCWNELSLLKNQDKYKLFSGTKKATVTADFIKNYSPAKGFPPNSPFENGFNNFHEFEKELINLRTACFIIIALSTGMRISEILSIQQGAITEEISRNHGTFYWLNAIIYKTVKSLRGVPRKWMCGELAAKAVRVLEEMSMLLRINKETPYLFSTIDQIVGIRSKNKRPFKAISKLSMQNNVREFCKSIGIKIRVYPHMFRRTFVRNMVRFEKTSLLALKDHLKHWSLYMTDWYVGVDPDLIDEFEIERQILSLELMDKICTSKVSGPGGKKWEAELNRRIEKGLLPRNFRGKAGSEFRKKLIEEAHDLGIVVIPCGAFTYCVFTRDKALCTKGEKPLPNLCKPTACSNSYITKEHVSAHKLKLKEWVDSYEKLTVNEKLSPFGIEHITEITKLKKVLKPFKN
jgi:integrase